MENFEKVDTSRGIPEVDPQEVSQNLNNVYIADVRTEAEFNGELAHIPGAHLIPLDTLAESLDQLPTDRPVVFVCRSGGRSAQATNFAFQNGIERVYNMKGGMILWNNLGLKIE